MKLGVIADTHSRDVPSEVLEVLTKTDLIVHAGDFCSVEDYKTFTALKEVKAVFGNMDDAAVRNKLPEQLIFEWEGFRIGLTHGEGPAKRVLAFVQEKFKKEKVDAVIYGHSHEPFNEVIDGVLYFNPGSPNDWVVAPYCSYGLIEVKAGKLAGRIIKVKS